MSEKVLHFGGSVPEHYEDYLGPFLFEPFALDLAARVDGPSAMKVLELACGTGRLTRHLLACLSPSATIKATDLFPDMLTVAMDKITDDRLSWEAVDMLNIPYEKNLFDWVVCQFGIMLVPDREKALKEIFRVLKPGGKLTFSVWGKIDDNVIWKIGGKVLESFLEVNPMLQDPGPFTMQDLSAGIWLMEQAGFSECTAATVIKTGVIGEAALAAKGFVQGLPVINMIIKKDPSLAIKIQEVLEAEYRKQLGDRPMQSSLSALVFQGTK